MKILLGLIALVGAVNCVCNTPEYDLDFMIDDLILDTDKSPLDGKITATEFQNELLAKWDTDNDEQVGKDEFVNDWVAEYSDCKDYTETFFDNMDVVAPYGQLTELDLTLQLAGLVDNIFQPELTIEQFRKFIHEKHPQGTPV